MCFEFYMRAAITLGFLEQGIKIAAEIKTTSSLKENSITGCMFAIDRFTGEVIDKHIEVVNE